MVTVNIHEAKTQLSKLLQRVHRGEEIVIAKAGVPIARLGPLAQPACRQPDLLRGSVDAEFFDPLPEAELAAWEGSPPQSPRTRPKKQRR